MFKLTLPWHITFFNDFHWFSMTFPGKMPFFQVNIKFNDFSSLGLNSMTFPGLCEPCQMTSKTPLTGCQVKPPDSCTPMKLTVLGPHVLSHGRTDDQLECRLPWQSPRSIGLCGSSWYPWCCGSSEWTCPDGPPPRFFPSPVCRASTVSRDIAFSPVPSDSSGQSPVPWSTQGPASEADSSPGSQVPEVERWRWTFPLANTHLPGAILNACRYEYWRVYMKDNSWINFIFCIVGSYAHQHCHHAWPTLIHVNSGHVAVRAGARERCLMNQSQNARSWSACSWLL